MFQNLTNKNGSANQNNEINLEPINTIIETISNRDQELWKYQAYVKYTKQEIDKYATHKLTKLQTKVEELKKKITSEEKESKKLDSDIEKEKMSANKCKQSVLRLKSIMQDEEISLKNFNKTCTENLQRHTREYENYIENAKQKPLYIKLQKAEDEFLRHQICNGLINNKIKNIKRINKKRNEIDEKRFTTTICNFVKTCINYEVNKTNFRKILELQTKYQQLMVTYSDNQNKIVQKSLELNTRQRAAARAESLRKIVSLKMDNSLPPLSHLREDDASALFTTPHTTVPQKEINIFTPVLHPAGQQLDPNCSELYLQPKRIKLTETNKIGTLNKGNQLFKNCLPQQQNIASQKHSHSSEKNAEKISEECNKGHESLEQRKVKIIEAYKKPETLQQQKISTGNNSLTLERLRSIISNQNPLNVKTVNEQNTVLPGSDKTQNLNPYNDDFSLKQKLSEVTKVHGESNRELKHYVSLQQQKHVSASCKQGLMMPEMPQMQLQNKMIAEQNAAVYSQESNQTANTSMEATKKIHNLNLYSQPPSQQKNQQQLTSENPSTGNVISYMPSAASYHGIKMNQSAMHTNGAESQYILSEPAIQAHCEKSQYAPSVHTIARRQSVGNSQEQTKQDQKQHIMFPNSQGKTFEHEQQQNFMFPNQNHQSLFMEMDIPLQENNSTSVLINSPKSNDFSNNPMFRQSQQELPYDNYDFEMNMDVTAMSPEAEASPTGMTNFIFNYF